MTNELPPTKKAITIKTISGSCIPTIPEGTELYVFDNLCRQGYYQVDNKKQSFPVTSVWSDEIRFI